MYLLATTKWNLLAITTAPTIPSFTALQSLLKVKRHAILSVAFTPVTPHQVTDNDIIFTTMVSVIQ